MEENLEKSHWMEKLDYMKNPKMSNLWKDIYVECIIHLFVWTLG